MSPFVAEYLGTAVMILLGGGVVANEIILIKQKIPAQNKLFSARRLPYAILRLT